MAKHALMQQKKSLNMEFDMKTRLIELINEVLEDINLFGADKKCIVYLDKETLYIKDYSLEQEKIIYLDEERKFITLFELLVRLVDMDYRTNKKELPAYSIAVKCCRQLTGLSQIKFAEFIGSTRRTVEDWESGKRNIGIEKLLIVAEKCGLKKKTILNVFFEDESK